MEVRESECDVPSQRNAALSAGEALVGDALWLGAVTSSVKRTKRRPGVGSCEPLRAGQATLPRSLLKFSGGHSSFRPQPDRTLRV